jgi:hypothetical protein
MYEINIKIIELVYIKSDDNFYVYSMLLKTINIKT